MRGIEHMHPQVRERAEKLVAECNKRGIPVLITETLRSKQEQDGLYAKGRTVPGNIVTNVRYPHSMHCWGLAFDFCKNVKGQEFSDAAFFQKVGVIGKKLGLTWGGDWKDFKDLPHFQLDKFGNTNQLISKYKTPENFKKTWINVKEVHKVEKIKVLINGVITEVEAITENNVNYIKLRDIQTKNINIGYENKMPTITTT